MKASEGDPHQFDSIANYEFPLYEVGGGKEPENIYQYDEANITLNEISGSTGTPYKPPLDKSKDVELIPEPKEPASPTKLEKTDEKAQEEEKEGEGEEEGEPVEGEGDDAAEALIEEEEEEFIMPVHVTIWYDFDALNAGDPILLA